MSEDPNTTVCHGKPYAAKPRDLFPCWKIGICLALFIASLIMIGMSAYAHHAHQNGHVGVIPPSLDFAMLILGMTLLFTAFFTGLALLGDHWSLD